MIVGIDMGGTHTDAVLIEGNNIIATTKTLTDRRDLTATISQSLRSVLGETPPADIKRINLSTTITTNAIIENSLERTALVIIPGPGCNPENYMVGEDSFVLSGATDHRGNITEKNDPAEMEEMKSQIRQRDLKTMAVVSKFSTRNSSMEEAIENQCEGLCDFITAGHGTAGSLNFPRRINTAYYNSAIWRPFNEFADSIVTNIKSMGIDCEVNVLKADGGTIPLDISRQRPVESILSGPSASIMGSLALYDSDNYSGDSIILDIGGTTTDIALLIGGVPLLEKGGATMGGKLTSVRALMSRSIGLGGDSFVRLESRELRIGPERRGAPLCMGGSELTVIDAFAVLGEFESGETEKSLKGISVIANELSLGEEETASLIIEKACEKIKDGIDETLREINSRPLYTVHEVIENSAIKPKRIIIIGAPAQLFEKHLERSLPVSVPENFAVANAIGAALSKTTMECNLFADSSQGKMKIPELGVEEKIDSRYRLGDGERDIVKYFKEHLQSQGVEIDVGDIVITDRSSFKIVRGYHSSGYDLRVKCQIKPGLSNKLSHKISQGGKK